MKHSLKNTLTHAEKKLAFKEGNRPENVLQTYRDFIRIEEHRIRMVHYRGASGREVARKHAELIDLILQNLFRSVLGWHEQKSTFALVAVGGYGRGELNPYSDIDILFLCPADHSSAECKESEMIKQILYFLWDLGFKIGHATRSISETITHANEDPISKTALLEARLVAGDKKLFAEFRKLFETHCVQGHQQEYLRWRVENQKERHEKFEKCVYLQEPNVKRSCGGLRDYQNLLWMAYFKAGILSTSHLVQRNYLSESERRRLEKAYDFILRVRTELHYQNNRSSDVLTLYLQGQIATKLGYPQPSLIKKSEAFMRDYYQHARNIYLLTASVAERLSIEASEAKVCTASGDDKEVRYLDGFRIEDGMLYPETQDIFKQDPMRMMRAFDYVQSDHLEMSASAQQIIRRRGMLVDRTFQYSKAARTLFFDILSRKGKVGRVLRLMHETDFLGRYIPEFGQLTCLVQHEFFHRYTADEHTLVCMEKLDQLMYTTDPKLKDYRALFEKLEDPEILYLAILLHDTGKASGAPNHAEASALFAHKVARRLQLSSEQRRLLLFLVDQHGLLSETAQRRNLEDEVTITQFASIVRKQAYLDALMLLTLVDGMGVGGSNVWSDWKERLVWQLYRGTSRFLLEGEHFYQQRREQRNILQEEVRRQFHPVYHEEVQVHFDSMPGVYFHSFQCEEVINHIRLFHIFFRNLLQTRGSESLKPVIEWVHHPEQGYSEVLVVTWDRKALMAKIAGSFAASQLNILSADIYTRRDDLVLDVFRVSDAQKGSVQNKNEIEFFNRTVTDAMLNPAFEFAPLLKQAGHQMSHRALSGIDLKTVIDIRNEVHPKYTLIDIQTSDRLGLLYDLLRTLADAGIDIALSRVATEKGSATDVFYVTDSDGKKLEKKPRIREIQMLLQKAAEQEKSASQ